MKKNGLCVFICLFICSFFCCNALSAGRGEPARDDNIERIELLTYYPAPYGVYKKLHAGGVKDPNGMKSTSLYVEFDAPKEGDNSTNPLNGTAIHVKGNSDLVGVGNSSTCLLAESFKSNTQFTESRIGYISSFAYYSIHAKLLANPNAKYDPSAAVYGESVKCGITGRGGPYTGNIGYAVPNSGIFGLGVAGTSEPPAIDWDNTGISPSGAGVVGRGHNYHGVYGYANCDNTSTSNFYGVYGESRRGPGVVGVGNIAPDGRAGFTDTLYPGVYGKQVNSTGVMGVCGTEIVSADSPSPLVLNKKAGILGWSYDTDGYAGYFSGGKKSCQVMIEADTDNDTDGETTDHPKLIFAQDIDRGIPKCTAEIGFLGTTLDSNNYFTMINTLEDTANSRLRFGANGDELVELTYNHLRPVANNNINLGGSSYKWKSVYAVDIYATNITGNVHDTDTGNDVAEKYIPEEPCETGDVLVISSANKVKSCSSKGDKRVIGVVSEKPGIVMDDELEGGIPIALLGKVPCKVDASFGKIEPGDLLVTSPTKGHAMKAKTYKPGTIVGKALESLKEGKGKIMILVTLM